MRLLPKLCRNWRRHVFGIPPKAIRRHSQHNPQLSTNTNRSGPSTSFLGNRPPAQAAAELRPWLKPNVVVCEKSSVGSGALNAQNWLRLFCQLCGDFFRNHWNPYETASNFHGKKAMFFFLVAQFDFLTVMDLDQISNKVGNPLKATYFPPRVCDEGRFEGLFARKHVFIGGRSTSW